MWLCARPPSKTGHVTGNFLRQVGVCVCVPYSCLLSGSIYDVRGVSTLREFCLLRFISISRLRVGLPID